MSQGEGTKRSGLRGHDHVWRMQPQRFLWVITAWNNALLTLYLDTVTMLENLKSLFPPTLNLSNFQLPLSCALHSCGNPLLTTSSPQTHPTECSHCTLRVPYWVGHCQLRRIKTWRWWSAEPRMRDSWTRPGWSIMQTNGQCWGEDFQILDIFL